MGIKQLAKLIKENTKNSIKQRKFNFYSGNKIAIDASLSIYQFLIAVRSDGGALGFGDQTTSHIIGMFYRTIRLLENGITPVYVFDGKAPAMKIYELEKRLKRREDAGKKLEQAEKDGDALGIEKYNKMKIKVEGFHVQDCQKLLDLMGIPYVIAESEAEAYCAFLCKRGCVDGVATEDMDTLCFGSPILLRNLNAAQSKKLDIDEYNLKNILSELEMNMEEFIDLCILMGCDYSETIRGVGPKRALDYIKKHRTIENILENEDLDVGENFDFIKAREIFKFLPEVGEERKFKIDYESINLDNLIEYLCKEKGFDETRVRNGYNKIMKSKKNGKQMKIESFFKKK